MDKGKIIYILLTIIVLGVAWYFFDNKAEEPFEQEEVAVQEEAQEVAEININELLPTVNIDGREVPLLNVILFDLDARGIIKIVNGIQNQ